MQFYVDYYRGKKLSHEHQKLLKQQNDEEKMFKPKIIKNFERIKWKEPFMVKYGKNNFGSPQKKTSSPLKEFMQTKFKAFVEEQVQKNNPDGSKQPIDILQITKKNNKELF